MGLKKEEQEILKRELLTTNPTRYRGRRHAEIAEMFGVLDQVDGADRETIETGQIVAVLVPSEIKKLKSEEKDYLKMVISAVTVPLTPQLRTELVKMFDERSLSRVNIAKVLKRVATLAEVLGIPQPTANDIADVLVRGEPK